MKVNIFKYSEKGPRNENEDAVGFVSNEQYCLCCVADGVGGKNCGAYAANYSLQRILSISPEEKTPIPFEEIFTAIHQELKEHSKQNHECEGMSTTLTSLLIKDNCLYGCHAGDSMLYVLRDNGLKTLTIQHTEAARLLHEGIINQETFKIYPRKNILESAIGSTLDLKLQTFKFDIQIKDRVILSTDGFYALFPKTELRDLSINSKSTLEYFTKIKQRLRTRRLSDNCSFIVLEILEL